MKEETRGIVLRQIKMMNDRRLIVLFTERFGKVAAGTSMSEKGKGKSALAVRPFTLGHYELTRSRDRTFISGGKVLRSHYEIGEEPDRYLEAAFALEFADKLLPEGRPEPAFFQLLVHFLAALEERKGSYGTLACGYLCRSIVQSGIEPELASCIRCGAKEPEYFSIAEGGLLCRTCRLEPGGDSALIFPVTQDIIEVLQFMLEQPLGRLDNLAIHKELEGDIRKILRAYCAVHLGVEGLKSDAIRL